MKSSEQLLSDWLDSVFERHVDEIIERLWERQQVEGTICEDYYKITYKASASLIEDRGDYWTPPNAELENIYIEADLQIFDLEYNPTIKKHFEECY